VHALSQTPHVVNLEVSIQAKVQFPQPPVQTSPQKAAHSPEHTREQAVHPSLPAHPTTHAPEQLVVQFPQQLPPQPLHLSP
jgi:hypothetical protein